MSAKPDSLKTIFFALGANFAIFAAKLVVALWTGSSALLAEAVHSLADCGNQGLLLVGIQSAKKPSSADYPLGHGKAIYFWSFLVALILFSMGGLFSIYEGVEKLHDPQPIRRAWMAIGVLAFSIAAESVSMWGCLREVNKVRENDSLWRWFRTSRQSELLVVFGEDLAALLGLVFALAAVSLTVATGNPIFDALGTLVIGVLLVVIAFFIAVEVKALLIGQSVDERTRRAMGEFLAARDEVDRVLNLLTLQLGGDVMLAVKAKMRQTGGTAELVADINRVEAALRARFPQVRWSFFEPDLED